MATKKQQQGNAKNKFARNQQIVGSLSCWMESLASGRRIWSQLFLVKKLCSHLRKGGSGERKPGSGRPHKTTV